MPYSYRSALAKFRCEVGPIRLETGRYDRLSVNERICPICQTAVENEIHVLLYCQAYKEIRETVFKKACDIDNGFFNMSDSSKLSFLL